MTIDMYSPDEQALLDAWFRSAPTDERLDGLLEAAGFDQECKPYTPLDAWVGAFAVAEIQSRLPNCGVCHADGVVLTRKFREVPDRQVTGMVRHLFTINWADSAPGISWPVAYNMVWFPGFERFVVTASADSTDMFGYCDFALGHFGPEEDWRQAVKEILQGDWRVAYEDWGQAAWAYLFESGAIPDDEAMTWRRELWAGTEWWEEENPGEEEEAEDDEPDSPDEADEDPVREQGREITRSSQLGRVTHVRIRPHPVAGSPGSEDDGYLAEVLRDGDQFHYRARGVTLTITDDEAAAVVSNPWLYYFSTALKLHKQIDHLMEAQAAGEGAS